MKLSFLKSIAFIVVASAAVPAVQGQDQPRIIGMAHMAYYISNVQQARDYYEGWLGFKEAFALRNPDGSVHELYIKINDHQYIELYAEPVKNYGFIHDAGFETNDAKGMRDHLASIGVAVPPAVAKNAAGNLSFDIIDPSGFTIEIVQYLPKSMTGKTAGKLMPQGRISNHIDHIGLLAQSREATWKFYSDAFGFTKEGDGSKMDIPGSSDRFEIGYEKRSPVEARFHVKDHICLSSPDVPKMTTELRSLPQIKEFPDAIADTHQLGNGKNVVEIYDLDHNRIEVMEPLK